jgi:hypothetical protein
MESSEPHPFAVLTDGQKYYFIVKLQANLGELTEYDDDLFEQCIIKMLENSRTREDMTESITDFIGREKTENLIKWMWDMMKMYGTEERYALLEPPPNPWVEISPAIVLPFVQYTFKKEIDFSTALEKLKFAVMKAARGPFSKDFPRPDNDNYVPFLIIKQSVTWLKYINFETADASNLMITNKDFREFFLDTLYIMGYLINQTIDLMEGEHLDMLDDKEEDDSVDEPFNSEVCVLPLAEQAAELIVLICKGISFLRKNDKPSDESVDLYSKYKKMSSDATEDISIMDLTDEIIGRLTPAMAEIFTVTLKGRLMLQEHPEISCVDFIHSSSTPQVKMLYSLVNALDTEMIIIHGTEKKGFLVSVSGCSDGKLFSLAMAANLVQTEAKEANLLTGTRPGKVFLDFLDSMGEQVLEEQWGNPFTISTWCCVKPDGSVPSGMAGASHWFYTDGSIKELPLWNGKRIAIIGKAPFAKKFAPVRVFDKLRVSIKIIKNLSEQEVTSMLQEIGKTEESIRNEAYTQFKTFKPV